VRLRLRYRRGEGFDLYDVVDKNPARPAVLLARGLSVADLVQFSMMHVGESLAKAAQDPAGSLASVVKLVRRKA
jgi:hypothetical protein